MQVSINNAFLGHKVLVHLSFFDGDALGLLSSLHLFGDRPRLVHLDKIRRGRHSDPLTNSFLGLLMWCESLFVEVMLGLSRIAAVPIALHLQDVRPIILSGSDLEAGACFGFLHTLIIEGASH